MDLCGVSLWIKWQVTQGFNVLDVAPDEHFARTCETVVRIQQAKRRQGSRARGYSLSLVKVPTFYKKGLLLYY